jgi:hypothetical protein
MIEIVPAAIVFIVGGVMSHYSGVQHEPIRHCP